MNLFIFIFIYNYLLKDKKHIFDIFYYFINDANT